MGRQILIAATLLGGFAVLGSTLVGLTHDLTAERIQANERAALLRSVNELVPADRYDNDLFNDTLEVRNRDMLGTGDPVTVFRARKGNLPVALIFTPNAPDGYSGTIRLLVAIYADGNLAGVRVLNHRETPGLGDAIEVDRSDWITRFEGKNLDSPKEEQWKVKRDGGVFDQFTGATITPRAVVKAVHKALLYFATEHERLFLAKSTATDPR
ncbi:MAG: electron transport complex subunit RsxG [Chromatiales bacterium]|nr:electron transport complex subunit RsxG [Chromatiales bacterium]